MIIEAEQLKNFKNMSHYWLNYWHAVVNKGTSRCTSNTLLIP